MENVINIVNFVRGCEPRFPEWDLTVPLINEIEQNKKYGFYNTILMQYDAMADDRLLSIVKNNLDDKTEVGIWIELADILVEKVGIKWRGREGYSWDWYVNPGFLLAYTDEEKEKIIDEIMRRFHECFGFYPKSIGSWILDSYSIEYITKKYDPDAFCICREQWGTDGYTLWGGYYSGGYYPCKNNMLSPAQNPDQQINTPIFRLLGSDPTYCYYEFYKERFNKISNTVCTLEAADGLSHNPHWVKWFLKTTFENENLGFGYAQAGQENAFPWEGHTEIGIKLQYEIFAEDVKKGKYEILTLGETGRRFKEKYPTTPPTAVSATEDWQGLGHQSVWYNCKNYRLNIYSDGQNVLIRDIHKFDEKYKSRYLDTPCTGTSAIHDNLPVVDSVRFTDDTTQAGWFFGKGMIISSEKQADGVLSIKLEVNGTEITVIADENKINMTSDKDFSLNMTYKNNCEQIKLLSEKSISFEHNGYGYAVAFENGKIFDNIIYSEKNTITIKLS